MNIKVDAYTVTYLPNNTNTEFVTLMRCYLMTFLPSSGSINWSMIFSGFSEDFGKLLAISAIMDTEFWKKPEKLLETFFLFQTSLIFDTRNLLWLFLLIITDSNWRVEPQRHEQGWVFCICFIARKWVQIWWTAKTPLCGNAKAYKYSK